ncbi:hypothetical protein FRB95_000475 [Tulasnella sp. JGI-2019a]|nr:hypothetical protein FRB95_000475 [Tulasnella sp. JGI-2019a]
MLMAYDRPEHSLHEGLQERPLFCNPILTHLAMFIAKGAFRVFKTVDQLLALQPANEEEMFLLRWEPHILDQPIYQRKNGKVESASTFSNRLRSLGRRAGYACPPTIHDFRAESLFLVDTNVLYSSSQRMRQAGHRDERTYSEFYAPTNPGTDGQGSYFGGTCRTAVNERFRSLTVAWNPELWQSLPAEEIFELENRPDFVAIEKELLDLFLYGNNTEESERRKQLQAQKRQLISDELRRLQSDQYRDISKDSSGPDALVGHQRTMFPRIRNLMGPRDRLANGLFLTAPIRSEAGRAVLHDLIALYTQTSEVEQSARCEAVETRLQKHLRDTYSFGEFCFSCNKWFNDAASWESHCQSHLDRQPPTQCNPFSYDKCIASPGFCPWCLGNTHLDAASRMRQFLEARDWRAHVAEHISALEKDVAEHDGPHSPLRCPHPRPQCMEERFDSVQRLVFHLQDVHCWMRATRRPRKSRQGSSSATQDVDEEEEEHYEEEYDDGLDVDDELKPWEVAAKWSIHASSTPESDVVDDTRSSAVSSSFSTNDSSSFSTASPLPSYASSSYASSLDDIGPHNTFNFTSYPSADHIKNTDAMPADKSRYSNEGYYDYTDAHGLPAQRHYATSQSAMLDKRPQASGVAESLRLAAPQAQLWHQAPGWNWAGFQSGSLATYSADPVERCNTKTNFS